MRSVIIVGNKILRRVFPLFYLFIFTFRTKNIKVFYEKIVTREHTNERRLSSTDKTKSSKNTHLCGTFKKETRYNLGIQ